jgi:hypothetical protein
VKHIEHNDADFVTPEDMLAEKEDNLALTSAYGRPAILATSMAMSPRPA